MLHRVEEVVFAVIVLLLLSADLSANDRMESLIKNCNACHSPLNDHAEIKGPELAGMKRSYITEQLVNFKQGLRGKGSESANVMARETVPLSENDIK